MKENRFVKGDLELSPSIAYEIECGEAGGPPSVPISFDGS